MSPVLQPSTIIKRVINSNQVEDLLVSHFFGRSRLSIYGDYNCISVIYSEANLTNAALTSNYTVYRL